jgi:cell cycle sensor histidine kinase DivJ
LRNTPAIWVAGLHWPDLVHDGVRDGEERARHANAIVTRLIAGALGLACIPPYLAWSGAPGWTDALLALSLAGPIFAAAILSLTGRMTPARAVSTAAFAGLAFCFSASTGAPALIAGFFMIGTAMVELAGGVYHRWHGARRRQHAVTLREVEDRSLIDVVGDVVTWHGRGGEVLRASGSAGRFIGAPTASLAGHGLMRHVHVSDRPIFLRALSDAANAAEPVTAEFRLHVGLACDAAEYGLEEAQAGSRVTWVEMRAHKVDGQGTGITVVSVIRDMSAARRHAEELEKARTEAERANELKGRFLATVTHELRTPLNAIIGFSELLTAEHPYVMTDERRKEYATIIRDSGHHLLEVVNTLLDMSKIETGNFNFEPESFCLADLVDGCCDLMQLRADQAGIRLDRHIARDLPEITADRRACRQIMINLVSNAVKFTPAGGRVTVTMQRDRDRLVLSVADTGIGIGEGDLPKLGDPFFQAGDGYRRPHDGTGLGLSVVRGLVGLHNGTLAIESGAGVGTTVTVTLPLAGCASEPDRKPAIVRTMVRPVAPAQILDRKSA